MTDTNKYLEEYLSKKIDKLTSMIPTLTGYDDDSKMEAILYHLQRLTKKIKDDMAAMKDTPHYEEYQLALALLDERKITKAFGVETGYFDEISKLEALSSEELYEKYRHHMLTALKIAKKEASCC